MLSRITSGVWSSMRSGENPIESSFTFIVDLSTNPVLNFGEADLYSVTSCARSACHSGPRLASACVAVTPGFSRATSVSHIDKWLSRSCRDAVHGIAISAIVTGKNNPGR